MSARNPRDAEIRTFSDRQAQANLERMLAARQAAKAAREARYRQSRTPRSQFRANAKAPLTDVHSASVANVKARRFTWRDVGVFLLPATLLAAAIVAHWAGLLP